MKTKLNTGNTSKQADQNKTIALAGADEDRLGSEPENFKTAAEPEQDSEGLCQHMDMAG